MLRCVIPVVYVELKVTICVIPVVYVERKVTIVLTYIVQFFDGFDLYCIVGIVSLTHVSNLTMAKSSSRNM
jgi:hypothetical protein